MLILKKVCFYHGFAGGGGGRFRRQRRGVASFGVYSQNCYLERDAKPLEARFGLCTVYCGHIRSSLKQLLGKIRHMTLHQFNINQLLHNHHCC